MMSISAIKAWFEKPVRFDYLRPYLTPNARVLDIGCGSKAPYSTFAYYPTIRYSGVDYADIPGAPAMEHFYKCDIENNDFHDIPDNAFDVIILSHIIEHVANGETLLASLVPKLAHGGVIYVETPSERSLTLPSWYGTFNFYDDPTHKRVYPLATLTTMLQGNGCTILASRVRRSIKRILLSPLYALHSLRRDRKISASVFWDMAGFAHYVIARRN